MRIRTRDLRAAPCARVHRLAQQDGGRVVDRLGSDGFRVLENLGHWVRLARTWRRCRNHFGDPCVVFGVEADVTVEAQRLCDLVAKVRAQTLAADAPDDL